MSKIELETDILPGNPVIVESPRYAGPGVAADDGRSHLVYHKVREGFMVRVVIPNGNTHFYEIQNVHLQSE